MSTILALAKAAAENASEASALERQNAELKRKLQLITADYERLAEAIKSAVIGTRLDTIGNRNDDGLSDLVHWGRCDDTITPGVHKNLKRIAEGLQTALNGGVVSVRISSTLEPSIRGVFDGEALRIVAQLTAWVREDGMYVEKVPDCKDIIVL